MVEAERVHQLPEAIVQKRDVVAVAQHARDLARPDARRDQEHAGARRRVGGREAGGHVVRRLGDGAAAPQVVVQAARDALLVEAEQDVDAGRLNVGVHDADAPAAERRERGQVGGQVRLAGAAAERMDGDDSGQRYPPRRSSRARVCRRRK
jgi:hypothetical protein